jgi:hypothetical protein
VPPDVEPVRETAPDQLGYERKQGKRKSGKEALVSPSALHRRQA